MVGHFFPLPFFFLFPFSPSCFILVLCMIFTHTARRNWTRYGKQTALPGRYQSNCLIIWFAVGFTSSLPLLNFFSQFVNWVYLKKTKKTKFIF